MANNFNIIGFVVIDKQYEVEYRDADGNSRTVEGWLRSLDDNGFVVIEDEEGQTMIIKKELVYILSERKERED